MIELYYVSKINLYDQNIIKKFTNYKNSSSFYLTKNNKIIGYIVFDKKIRELYGKNKLLLKYILDKYNGINNKSLINKYKKRYNIKLVDKTDVLENNIC